MLKRNIIFPLVALIALATGPALAHEHGEGHQETAFATMTEAYLNIQTALATDTLAGIKEQAGIVMHEARELQEKFDISTAGITKSDGTACMDLMPKLAAAAEKLAVAKDLATARTAFADLSENLVTYRNMVPGDEKPHVAYCPMVKHRWLQNGKKITNPYFGSKMLRCGKIVE